MAKAPAMVTEGSAMLTTLLKTQGQAELSRRFNCSKMAVYYWSTGRNSPSSSVRDQMSDLFGIPRGAWDVPLGTPIAIKESPSQKPNPAHANPMPIPNGKATMAAPKPGESKNRAALESAHEQLDRLMGDIYRARQEGCSYVQLMAIEKAYAQANKQVADLSGQNQMSESTFVRSPFWARALRMIGEAARDYPDAAKAIAERLRAFGEEGET